MKNKIAILITCFNRRDITLFCLKRLETQENISTYDCHIFLVDDGADGTSDKVTEQFSNVTIIKGTGNLYWNGGMRLAFSHAMEWNPDYYIWLNDDVILYPNAIARLLATESELKSRQQTGIVIGSMRDKETKLMTYGGKIKTSKINTLKSIPVMPDDKLIKPCDLINGNFVLISNEIVQVIGNLSKDFTHGMGDYDYGLRAIKAGFSCWVASGYFGTCSNNLMDGSCKDSRLSVNKRVDLLNRPTGLPPSKEWMTYTKRHGGYLWPYFWIRTVVRLLFPQLWVYFRAK